MGMSSYVLDEEDKKLETWLAKVDKIFLDKFGVDRDSFPDWNWAECCEVGYSPREAFDAFHEEMYGDTYENINGRSGVGA